MAYRFPTAIEKGNITFCALLAKRVHRVVHSSQRWAPVDIGKEKAMGSGLTKVDTLTIFVKRY